MSRRPRNRLAYLAGAVGTVLLLAAAPSLADAGPTAPVPDLQTISGLLQEQRPGTAGMPRAASPEPTPTASPTASSDSAQMATPESITADAPAPARAQDASSVTFAPDPGDRATSGVYWNPDPDGDPVDTPPPPPMPAEPDFPPVEGPPAGPPQPTPSATPAPTPAPPEPTPAPTPEPTVEPQPGPPSASELLARVIELTNSDRAKAGCQALTPSPLLADSAQGHADDMSQRNYFSHTSLDGRTFDQRIRNAGYTGKELGENIASGFPTAEEVQDAWMHTPGHRRNILDCSFREIGVGYADAGQFWVVNFGG